MQVESSLVQRINISLTKPGQQGQKTRGGVQDPRRIDDRNKNGYLFLLRRALGILTTNLLVYSGIDLRKERL